MSNPIDDTRTDVGVRVLLDTGRCRAYGICVGLAPEFFDLPKGGKVAALRRETAESAEIDDLEEAAFSCPAQAIALIGEQEQS